MAPCRRAGPSTYPIHRRPEPARQAQESQPNPDLGQGGDGQWRGAAPIAMEEALRTWMADAEGLAWSSRDSLAIPPSQGRSHHHVVRPRRMPSSPRAAKCPTVVCRSGYSSQLDLAASPFSSPRLDNRSRSCSARFGRTDLGLCALTQPRWRQANCPTMTGSLPKLEPNVRAFEHLSSAWLQTLPGHPA